MKTLLSQRICPICGHRTLPRFQAVRDYRIRQNKKEFNMFWCDRCHYGMISPRPLENEVANFYKLEDYYTHGVINKKGNKEKSFSERLRTHIAWWFDNSSILTPNSVLQMLEDTSPSICEIGCGNGGNLLKFQAEGFRVAGVEPDAKALIVAKSKVRNIFDGTAEKIPENITQKKYDAMLLSHVLEHCLDVNKSLSNASNLLRKDGLLIVEVPNCQSLGFKYHKERWPWTDIPRHLNFFTEHSLKKLFDKHRMEICSVQYRGFTRQFSNAWLQNQQKINSFFQEVRRGTRQEERNLSLYTWCLLFRMIFASKAKKYDSVRIMGRKHSK